EEAEPLYRRSLAIIEKHKGAENTDTARYHRHLADLYANQRRYAEAEALYRRSLELYEKHASGPHPGPAMTLNGLALMLFQSQGRHADVEPLFLRSLEIHEELANILGGAQVGMVDTLNNLAS